ncbi:uncharacterized protein C8Q71DRAFT_410134 [Rhodofomes roseus]|uniref:F-box domain-containing protein n=1 Tax=Rhodofomes roseus TaxID=34475 RepID=A0ABQ8JZA0_9APHY|nr:uncharacterized protein C8Q71DRAFT_410134 [Rhodofomes roseus]KAH9829391.1 hypothetical protein C8Q71DRAFT_410134 [Rhodofomes roseus]
MAPGANILSLNDDILGIIVAWLPQRDAAKLALTSRVVSTAARRRILSSLQLTAPVASVRFRKFMLDEDDGYRLQCLRKLTIHDSNVLYEPPDGYTPLADVLERVRNLQTLVVTSVEEHLADPNGYILGDAIASLRDLRELDLRSVDEEGLDLCKNLTCKPDVFRLEALSSSFAPHVLVDRTMLSELNVLQRASVITLHDFTFVEFGDQGQPLSPPPLPKPTALWPSAKTLRLRNMDPMPVVALCPNLACLHLAAVMLCHDGGDFYPSDVHNPYSITDTLEPQVTARLRVFDVFVDNEESRLTKTIVTIVRATYPRAFSTQFHYCDTGLWGQLASLAKRPDSRLRYLDVLLHENTTLAQKWLDECLPQFSDCGILCVRIRLVESIGNTITEQEWQSLEAHSDDWDAESDWEELRDTAPELILHAIPSLRYVSVSPGYMMEDRNGHDEPAFVGWTQWWRVPSGNSETASEDGQATTGLVQIDAGEGWRIHAYMRSEAFQEGNI